MMDGRLAVRGTRRVVGVALAVAGVVMAAAGLNGCSKPPRRVTQVDPVVREVPEALRGTIGTEVQLRGTEPQLVSGFGLVVGLAGTGGGELPVQIQATMERELARGGVGRGGQATGALAGKSPREVLRDPNVAVVIVEAAVSPGAPEGFRFDVRVRTLPGSSVTSLEGGTLWTTDLRLGPATSVGGYRTRKIAEAWGPIFINPFAEPGNSEADSVSRTVGRILEGGVVTYSLPLELVLDNPSHARARSITAAINSRFPQGPGDEGPIARGRSAERVQITIPMAYRARPAEFLELVRTTRIDQSFPQEYAKRYIDELQRSPELADDLSWCLQALGRPAVPFLLPMYDYPEVAPRMAALRAGARLGDMRAVPHLVDVARSGPPSLRDDALELLGGLPANPNVNFALREFLESPELDVRIAAYEALARRGDPLITRTIVGEGKFEMDVVPVGEGLIYVTQQGRPRIVLLGSGTGERLAMAGAGARPTAADWGRPMQPLKLRRPVLVSAWSDRLMLNANSPTEPLRVLYRDYRSGRTVQANAPEDVGRFAAFLAHKPSPEDPSPGLNLSYSEVVGALHQIQRQGGIDAGFATERDRLLANLLRAADETFVTERPEVSAEQEEAAGPVLIFRPQPAPEPEAARAEPGESRRSLVVPIAPRTPAPRGEDR